MNAGDDRLQTSTSAALTSFFAWWGVLVVAAAALAAVAYTSRDPDSTVYSEISARLSRLPVSSWLAPDWGGSWNFTGPFREHPFGIFVLPAALGRFGYPPLQAAFAVGAAASIASVILIKRVAAPLMRDHQATAVQWAALILPIAFTYRVRANQEYPVLVMTLFGLHAVERSRHAPRWIAGVIAAMCGLALIKGIFVVFLPIVCACWLLLVPAQHGKTATPKVLRPSNDALAWAGIGLAIAAVVLLAWSYELAYRRLTGDSFLGFYLTGRIGENAGLTDGRAFSVGAKFYNVFWYTGRVVWFALPGSLVLLLSATAWRRQSFDDLRAVWFALLSTAAYVGAMSLGANKAERFIFPAYFLIGSAGAVVAMRRWRGVDRFARRIAAWPAYALPLAWLALFMLTLASERRLPYIKVWSS